ncbi:tomoregulin-2 isoform X1 [Stegastes partitus]|uniref:Tomoregulin-2 isoform X1 n=1 Tax=Stegastes partitus TaxID=144197 RepID=A0A9Y4N6E9_9TELE|nr:PREDICTED: tomoregulin-2 isoform X1 [Stegastes partitus]
MGLSVVAQAQLEEPRRLRQWSGTAGGWLRITLVSFLATLPVEQLRAFPSSLSDCQTPTGWNCSGFDDRDTDLFLCDTNTCKFDGECLRIGNMVTCICDFKCNNDYAPVCGSNNKNYQNECFLRRDACKQQSEVLIMSEGDCPADAGSGSGDDGGEGSAETGQKETSTCDICQFGAECDVDAEDVWCVCNIDCSHISFNPVCASDGRSYDNPCQVKEASCQKQERIEVDHLGRCRGDIITGNNRRDEPFARTDLPAKDVARPLTTPCPDHYKNYCVHGECQFPSTLAQPSCSCHSGFRGPQCDIKEYNVLYVVPGSGKLHYVLIASIIGALQVVIICVVVLCITRKCPRTNRINRQKQNNVHFSSENTMRASTRLI